MIHYAVTSCTIRSEPLNRDAAFFASGVIVLQSNNLAAHPYLPTGTVHADSKTHRAHEPHGLFATLGIWNHGGTHRLSNGNMDEHERKMDEGSLQPHLCSAATTHPSVVKTTTRKTLSVCTESLS